MKTISSTKSKQKLSMPIVIGAGVIILLFLIVLCFVRAGAIPGLGSTADVPQNSIQVGYIESASAAGTDLKSVLKFKTIYLPNDVEEEPNMVVADDAIYPDTDIKGYVLKLDLAANTMVTKSMICPLETDDTLNNTARFVEVSYVTPSTDLEVGDYIDIRLKVSNSKNEYDYRDDIVVSKKEIVAIDGTNLTLKLNEDELISLTAAAVDMTISNSTKDDNRPVGTLYTTQYISAGQAKAEVTYSNEILTALIKANPNLLNNPTALYQTMIKGK